MRAKSSARDEKGERSDTGGSSEQQNSKAGTPKMTVKVWLAFVNERKDVVRMSSQIEETQMAALLEMKHRRFRVRPFVRRDSVTG